MENGDAPARVKVFDFLLRPRRAWQVVAEAPLTTRDLVLRYILPLAAIPAVAKAAGTLIFGIPVSGVSFHPALPAVLLVAALTYAAALAVVFALSGVIQGFAGVFDGDGRCSQALKLATFASIPGWLGGVFLLFPGVAVVAGLMGLYGFFLLAVGIRPVMGVTRERSVIYGALALVLFALFWGLASLATAAGSKVGLIPRPGEALSGEVSVRNVGSINLRKASEALRQLHADQSVGGKPIVTTPPDELETLLPSELATGYQRVATNSRVLSAGKLSGSTAQGDYRREERRIVITLSDAGAAKALMDAVMLRGSRESAEGYEKASTVNGRPTFEKYDRIANSGEYAVVVAGRYIVQVRGDTDIGSLKAAAQAVDFTRLEAMAKG